MHACEIRATSGRYTSYWNTILYCLLCVTGPHGALERQARLPTPSHTPPSAVHACEIRATSGRYTSYWNAILYCLVCVTGPHGALERQARPPTSTPQKPPPHPSTEHVGRYGQRAGGTHPTEMRSCIAYYVTLGLMGL